MSTRAPVLIAVLAVAIGPAALCGAGAVRAQTSCGGRVGVTFGETLGSIAERCGTNVEALKQRNPGLTGQTLRNGATINVPPPILPRGVRTPDLPRLVYPSRRRAAAPTAESRPRIYRIRRGDTLSGIAARYGTTVGALLSANPDVAPRKLPVGGALVLPSG